MSVWHKIKWLEATEHCDYTDNLSFNMQGIVYMKERPEYSLSVGSYCIKHGYADTKEEAKELVETYYKEYVSDEYKAK